jgi:hypothetical protein
MIKCIIFIILSWSNSFWNHETEKKKIIRGTEKVVLGDKRPGICDEEKVQHSPIRRGRDLDPPNCEL